MTVQELIDYLIDYPPDCEIVIQKDAEGNGYNRAYATGLAFDDESNDYPDVEDEENLEDIYQDEPRPKKKVVIIV